METAYIVNMQGIVKNFPGTRALDGVDLQIKKGEIHALLGENGAGKSTLMNILLGVYAMDEGKILYEGKELQIKSPAEALKLGIAMIPQELNLVPEASVAENIFLGNEQRSAGGMIRWSEVQKKAKEVLEGLGVSMDVGMQVKKLSASYQQLVLIARSLAYNPKVLILDEPTAALTQEEAKMLFAAMGRLKEKGTAMIFITHHLNEVMAEADRMTILRDGQLVHVCEKTEITKDQIISFMANRQVTRRKKVKRQVFDEVFFEVKHMSRKSEYEDVSFQVRKGEILCFAGLIGAGRTELFQSVYGLTKPDSEAEIYFEGKRVNIDGPRDAIRLGIGYVPEERRLMGIFPILDISENMMLPAYRQYVRSGLIQYKKVRQTADEYVDRIRVKTPSLGTLIRNLSGGNQQKVIVARWLAKGIRMMILDEPTRGIDVNAKDEIHNLITELADQGVTVIVISSEMEEVMALADRIIVMHAGKVQGEIEQVELVREDDILKVAFQDS